MDPVPLVARACGAASPAASVLPPSVPGHWRGPPAACRRSRDRSRAVVRWTAAHLPDGTWRRPFDPAEVRLSVEHRSAGLQPGSGPADALDVDVSRVAGGLPAASAARPMGVTAQLAEARGMLRAAVP